MLLLQKPSEIISNSKLKNINPQKAKKILIIFYAFLFMAILYHLIFARRIIPGVRVAGVRVGGMEFSQAKKTLEKNLDGIDGDLKMIFEDKEFLIRKEDIGLSYDWENSVVSAFEVGRSGNFFVDTKDKFIGLFGSLNIPASYDFDADSLGMKLSIIKSEINIEPLQSGIELMDGELEIIKPYSGQKVTDEKLYEKVIYSFDNMDFSEKEIPVRVIEPEIFEKDMEMFTSVVEDIISENLTLNFDKKEWVLGSEEILNLIGFKKDGKRVSIVLDEFSFDNLSDEIGIEINEFPRGQVVSTNGNKVTEFRIVGEGKELDVEKFKKDITDSIFNDRKPVSLTLNQVTDANDKDKYGIVELLGEGTSHFKGSIPSRIHNLTLAAENTSGVLVPPGAIYSMNDSVGPIDYLHGFQSAYIIKGGRTVLGEGGGVCQTSTTLFRAVLNSGLPILARYPHAYRVGYYEQDMPVGFDAAVFQPSWDFKFKNDTNAYVLVQTSANLEENSLTFSLYGTSDGRTVEISDPVITGQIPPPAPLYEDDPELPKGVVRQVDYPAWGTTSSFTRTVKMGDKVLFTDTYTSKYQPWRAIYKVGTKEE
ncbi:VanW family protein [Patescibacteria group bacterium]|nr:VanW family protein [Patescibacteria group bacterium]